MKMLLKTSSVLVVLVFTGLTAVAQDQPPGQRGGGMGGRMPNFADLDKNKDKKISRDEWQGAPQFFDRLDENKDGFIDEEEFNRMRGGRFGGGGGPRTGESLGKFLDSNQDNKVTREEFARLTELFDALDKDHNGELTTEELNGFFEAVRQAPNQATGGVEVQNLFIVYDKNKDGKITADEMAGPHERQLKQLDLNKDGALTREEAEQAIKQIADRARQKKQTPPQAPDK